MGDAAGGGGGGGHDGTNTLAASLGGGMTGQTPWRHPQGGGDGTNTLMQPHYPIPTKSVNPAGARGGRLGTTIKEKQVGGIAKRCEKR